MHQEYQSPLTSRLFLMHRNLEPILDWYPKAYTAIGTMRNRFGAGDTITLEGMLRELKESKEQSKLGQFKQMPLYLQHLFSEICLNYCRHPMNYATLVSETSRSDISEVAYITLNYDLFLETALNRENGQIFNSIDDYIPTDKNWIYAKLHGSINWGKKIKAQALRNNGDHINALLDNVERLSLETDLEAEIEIDASYKERPSHVLHMYPAMTVPVDNKYEFNCPTSHINRLKAFLKDCTNFLIIGVSGKDKDLLDLLRTHVSHVNLVCMVGGKHVSDAQMRFKEAIPQFSSAGWRMYDDGFSSFLASRNLEPFINDASG